MAWTREKRREAGKGFDRERAKSHSPLMPTVDVIGGPNGAGKTSLAYQLLPAALCRRFVNADEIAAGLSPFVVDAARVRAGRLMLRQIRELAAGREDFAFESTLSSRILVRFLRDLRRDGYRIHLTYLYLHSANLALQRVHSRVRCGGHGIPERDVERRYRRSMKNLGKDYLPLADQWRVYDNSAGALRVIARGDRCETVISDQTTWQRM
ncbi:MAG: zeta toxin family protein [Gammaproteobacteria bacterium]|nr:zeta toxin family protein [Gammaproteobacteria bacterium]